MLVEFHPDADLEFTACALFYEQRVPGLGKRFIDEVETGIEVLISQPQIGRQLDPELRCFVLDSFPVSLIYTIEPGKILIVAMAHQKRLPGYWQDRIKQ